MRVLIDGIGSPVWGAMKPFLAEVAEHVVGIDIDRWSYGLYSFDKGCLVPKYSEPGCFERIFEIIEAEGVDVVFPMVHEGLTAWAERAPDLARRGVRVLLSPLETMRVCNDKWATYEFFRDNGIPTPRTSLEPEYDLLKPRLGRGGAGIARMEPGRAPDGGMDGFVSQEFVDGPEFSVDALCGLDGEVLCVVPRQRLGVESGLSVVGRVVNDPEIEAWVRRILAAAPFVGPVDIQCFRRGDEVLFSEINARLAGGMSLSMHATDNWFRIIADVLAGGRAEPLAVRYGTVMMRHFSDVILHEDDLL